MATLQATTAVVPEQPPAVEIHGERGTATVSGSWGHLGFRLRTGAEAEVGTAPKTHPTPADRGFRGCRPRRPAAARGRRGSAQGARGRGGAVPVGQHGGVGDGGLRIIGGGDSVREGGEPRAAVFDMDGVLVDSEPYHNEAWRRLCQEQGVILAPSEVAERTLGRPVRESLPDLLGRPVDPAEIERLTCRKAALYEQASGGIVREVPGVVTFVRSLADLGVRRALATSAMPERVEPILGALRLDDQFQVRVTGHDVRRGKPDPEVYLTTAARLGIGPGACVAFEDAPVGVVAARLAGMTVVGVATSCRADALQVAGAHAVVPDFSGVTWREFATLG
jgi:HAD superfamily hydrolase (TIGR01509 family)